MEVVGWTWRVKLSLHLSLDLMRDLRERAEEEAIHVFARNLKDLLLAAPAGSRATMGLDPGIRTGVKVAVVDGTGKLLTTTTVYPFPPRNDVRGTQAELARLDPPAQGRADRDRQRHRQPRDGEAGGRHAVRHAGGRSRLKVIVSEAGASVYSASETAAAEFPGSRRVAARRRLDRAPPAGSAGRTGQDRAEVDRRRPVPARCRPVPARPLAGSGGRRRGERRRRRSQHGLGAAAGARFRPRRVACRSDRRAPRRRPALSPAARSCSRSPRLGAARLRAMRRLPAHPERQRAARCLLRASGSLWRGQEDRRRLRPRSCAR